MNPLEEIGKLAEPAVAPLLNDAEDAEKNEVRRLIEQNDKLIKALQEKKEEKKQPAKKKSYPGLPLFGKKDKLSVYLILKNNNTAHTHIMRFWHDKMPYFYLDHNKRVYDSDEVANHEILSAESCNFVFLEENGLHVGECLFAEKAQAEIDSVDRMKMEDRAYEKSHYRQKKKFNKPDGINVIIAIILLCVGVFLVLWVLFGGLPNVISAINAAASIPHSAQAPANVTFVG